MKKAKKANKAKQRLRALIQLSGFLFFPSAFTAAFAGVKYIASQLGTGEKLELTAFSAILIGLCVYTILFGRFFCGFACAFGSLGDAVRAVYVWICKKIKKKPITLKPDWCARLQNGKYLILIAILVLSFLGEYSRTRGYSPWDVFSMIRAGNPRFVTYVPGLVLLVLILVGMCLQERFFCRFLCPMGAVFSLLPVLPVFSLRRSRESCLPKCSGCTRNCPAQIELPSDGSLETAGDCFQCGKCIGKCPKKNIHCGFRKLSGNEIWFTIVRTILLFGLFYYLGI
jgi:polyferredoxin